MEYAVLVAVGICGLVALRNWRLGILLCIAVGFAMDPLRKVIDGQSSYMVALVAVVFLCSVGGLLLRNYRFDPTAVPGWRNGIAQALIVLVIMVVLQMFNAYLRFDSLALAGLGGLTYIAPVLAVFAGYYFACRQGEEGVDRLLMFYAVICGIFASGIYLEYFGISNSLLGEVGSGLVIYDLGTILNPYSGFFRASEVAAWHVFFGSVCLTILAVRSRSISMRWLLIACIILLVGAGVLTGRRKMVVTVTIFITCYWLLMQVLLRRSYRLAAIILLLVGSSLWVASRNELLNEQRTDVYGLYVERASGVFGDVGERAHVLGYKFWLNSIRAHGLFGKGAGTASQGARFIQGSTGIYGEAEGGLGKVVAEVGLFGFLVVTWLVVMMAINAWRILRYLAYRQDSFALTCCGLVAALGANIAHFAVAAQVFSDPFILILLGLVSGIIMSAPMLVHLRDRRAALSGHEALAG